MQQEELGPYLQARSSLCSGSPALFLAREESANSSETSLSETGGAYEDGLAGRSRHVALMCMQG